MNKSLIVFIFSACFALCKCAFDFETLPIDATYAQALLNEYRNSKISTVNIDDRTVAKFKYLLSPRAIERITSTVNELHGTVPNISNVPFTQDNERVTVIGDLHGQFTTLLHIVTESDTGHLAIGTDSAGMRRRYVFVGDYINREFDSLPVLMLAYVMKCAYPGDVFLIRGNHETAGNASTNGAIQNRLVEELKDRYPKGSDSSDILGSITNSFKYLPLGYVIDNSILVVHAGFGSSIKAMNDIDRKVADPSGTLYTMINARPVNIRAGATSYSMDQVREFLDGENLKLLVRGHDSPRNGIQNIPESKINGKSVFVTVHSASFCCPDHKSSAWHNKNAGGYIHFFNRGPNIGRLDVFMGDVTSTTPSQTGMNSSKYIRDKNARQVEQLIVKSEMCFKPMSSKVVPNRPIYESRSEKTSWIVKGSIASLIVLSVAVSVWYIRNRKTGPESL